MESLRENRALLISLLSTGGLVMALAMGLMPDFAEQFEIVDFPPKVKEINIHETQIFSNLQKTVMLLL